MRFFTREFILGSASVVPKLWLPSALFAAGEQGAWYDPSDMSTLFQDVAGVIPVTALGQPVGLIRDKSGRGNHAFQVTTTKRPLWQQDAAGLYHLLFDGIDDCLYTLNVDFSMKDKISVFSGLRTLSGSTSMLMEFGTNVSAFPGTFYITTNEVAKAYTFLARGSLLVAGPSTPASFLFPNTAVVTGIADISAKYRYISANSQSTTDLLDIGTGNFSSRVLYIGSRGNSSLFLNGKIYSLILRGALSTASEIAIAEKYVNSKTGVY